MEYGHPVAPSHGHQQMVRPHAPLYDEEPRTEPRLHAVVPDEQQHHEKKPVLKKVKDKVKKIKDTITKKRHGHGDDHDGGHYVEGEGYDEEEDEEVEVEPDVHGALMYEPTTIPHVYGSRDEPFTLDRRAEHIDLGTLDFLSGRDEHIPLSRRDVRPVILTGGDRDEHVPLGPISRRDESPVTVGSRDERARLGGLQEPPITPETIKDTTLEAGPAAPLTYGSVPLTDIVNISGPTPSSELSVSPEVLMSLEGMTISLQQEGQRKDQHGSDTAHLASHIEQKPTYTEKLSSTAAGAKDAAMSAASTVYSKVAGTTPTGAPTETRSTEEVEKKPSYTERLSSTATAAKDAAVSAASNVYGKVAGGTHSTEPHVQGSTPVNTGRGVEVEGREGAGEKKRSYTEKLSSTAAATKDAAVSAASNLYGKVAGGTHSTESHHPGSTLLSTGRGVEVKGREDAGENKGSYAEKLSSTAADAKDAAVSVASNVYGKVAGGTHSTESHDQGSTPLSTGPGVEVEVREGAGENKGSYTEKLSSTAAAAKDAAVHAASAVYGKVAGGTHSTESHHPGSTLLSTGRGVEVKGREDAGENKGSYAEKLSSTAADAKNAAVSAASNVYGKVAGGTHSTEPHVQGSTPLSTGRGVEVEVREGAGENKGSYTEKLSSTAAAAKDAAVHAASAVYGKVAGGTHSSMTDDQVVTPVRTGPRLEVEAREAGSDGGGEKKGTYAEKLSGTALAAKDAAVNAASTVYGKVARTGTAVMKVQPGGETEQDKGVSVREYLVERVRPEEEDRALSEVISESMKKRGKEQRKGEIVLPEVTASGRVGEKLVVGTAEDSRGGGEGMVEKIKGAVSSLVGGGGGYGGSAAATEGTGGGAARERADEELDY